MQLGIVADQIKLRSQSGVLTEEHLRLEVSESS